MTLAYVSGGSNLDAEVNLRRAAQALRARHPGTRFSRCYRNKAVGFDGPDFINFVAEVPVRGDPRLLKGELECIETQCGRPREAPKWAPRAMDLDILLFGDRVQDAPGLVLPRPDLLRWGFMLGPLAELAPALEHPLQKKTFGDLWREFDQAAHPMSIEPLDLNEEWNMYVVTGVGGYVGAQTARRLMERVPANRITVTSRNEKVLAEWRAKGARGCKADYNDKASMIEAFRGAECVFLVSAMEVGEKRQAQHRNAVEAAKAAGVNRVVYTSFLGAGDPNINSFEIADHKFTEKLIQGSGLGWNFMRNSQYGDAMAENQAAIAITTGKSIGNAGNGRVAFISRDDVAAVAAALIAGVGERNRAYDVTGPESVSWNDVAALVAELSGAKVEVVDLTDEQMYAMWDSLGVPREATGDFSRSPVPWCSDGMVSLGREIRLGHLSTVTNVVEVLTGHKPKSLRDLMKEKAPSWPKAPQA